MKKWCLVILALMLCGCSASTKTAETEAVKNDRPVLRTETGSEEKNFTVFAMDTVMQFQIYGGNDDVEEKVRGKIEELEDTLSVTKEGSPMWNLNEKKNENFAEEFANLMLQSLKLCKDTDGALDISAYPIVKAWGFTTGEHRIPDEEERKALVSRVDYRKIQVNGNTVSIEPDMMDRFGKCSEKGYTCAEVRANLMKEEGVTFLSLFSLGGHIQTVGYQSPDGADWFQSESGQQKRYRYLGRCLLCKQDKAVGYFRWLRALFHSFF